MSDDSYRAPGAVLYAQMEARRYNKSYLMRLQLEYALKASKTVTVVTPAPGGGIHACTVYPFKPGAKPGATRA